MKEFEKFLTSPFVRSKRNLGSLLAVLKRYHPEFIERKVRKDKVYGEMFGDEEFSAKKLENLALDLLHEAESFIAHKAVESDEIEKKLYLSHGLYDRQLISESFRILKKIETSYKLSSARGQSHYSILRRVNFMKSSFFMKENDFKNNIDCVKRIFQSSVLQALSDYSLYLGIKKPALTTYNIDVSDGLLESVFSEEMLEKFLSHVNDSGGVEYLPATLNYFKLKTINEPEDESYYEDLKKIFYGNMDKLGREDRHIIFSHMANYCVQKIIGGRSDYRKEGLDVYKKMILHEAYSLSDSEYIQSVTFRNIVQFCLTNNDPDWLEWFLTNRSEVLPPEERGDRINYSFAQLYFMKREFEKALESASKIRKEFFLYKTDERNLLLRIYYELNYYDAAFSLVDSYRHFLSSSSEISDSHKTTFRNFLTYYNLLLKIKCGQINEQTGFIKERILSEKYIVSRQWLADKADELISSKQK